MNETKTRSNVRRVLCAFFACVLVVSACFAGMPASSAAGTLTDAKVQGFEDQIAKLQEEQNTANAQAVLDGVVTDGEPE